MGNMGDINLFKAEESICLKKINSKKDLSKIDISDGYLIDTKENEKEVRRIADTLKKSGKVLAVVGGDGNFNRRVLETIKIDYLVSPELTKEKDTLKQRSSGLNHVLGKIAAQKNIQILVDMGSIKKQDKKEQVKRIARIIQNVKICRRAKCKIKIVNLAENEKDVLSEKQRKSFGFSVGMSSQEVSKCCEF